MLVSILSKCDERYNDHCEQCGDNCKYEGYCPGDCEKCLDYIHNHSHAPDGAPERKYDCKRMADMYTCKYSCRYTSEIVYALRRIDYLKKRKNIKVLSFGCGPCTDLFALDYLNSDGEFDYQTLEYRGIDYSRDVWKNIHHDIKQFNGDKYTIKFFYKDMCEIISDIANGNWTPNLIVFQYVFSDMYKNTGDGKTLEFIDVFSEYYNEKIEENACVILNDINLSKRYNGGREYFDQLASKLESSSVRKGRFCNDNARSTYYPRGYDYGQESDGEFPENRNLFDLNRWQNYSPYKTCASAQMIIKKEKR